MTQRRALLCTVLIVLLSAVFVVAISDGPVRDRASARNSRTVAALAVRDHVVPFQKWGTKLFTLPALERHYAEAAYFTQRWPGDHTEELLRALSALLSRHDSVDLFVLAHSNALVFEVARLDPALRSRLRLVYDTGCADASQAAQWIDLGSDVYVGHPGTTSISPVFYFYFLRRWLAGWDVSNAAKEANHKTAARLDWATPIAGQYAASGDLAEATLALVVGDGKVRLRP